MDKLTDTDVNQEKKEGGFFGRLSRGFEAARAEREGNRSALLFDILLFSVGFILARLHLAFGAYPAGIAFVATLPGGVFTALLGCVVGSLSMGMEGIIFAAVATVTVFLRAAISGGGEGALFSETPLLRICASVIGGFIAAAYTLLISGLSESTVLTALSMVLLPPTLVFIFSGLFGTNVTPEAILVGTDDIFSLSRKDGREKYNLIFFQISALMLAFFISLSLSRINLFGISLSYIFTVAITLLVAKRFGALRALAVGFVTSLGVSSAYSVSFGLMGLGAGLMFSFGTGYAIISGGAALSAWGIYSEGLSGFLATFPEYAIAATLSVPILKKISEIRASEEIETSDGTAETMIGTMALAYQNSYSGSIDSLVAALSEIGEVVRSYSASKSPGREDYIALVQSAAEQYCKDCTDGTLCDEEKISPCIKNAEKIAEKLVRGESICAEDVNTDTEFCKMAEELADAINRGAAQAEEECYRRQESLTSADQYELISKLICGARLSDDAERCVDSSMTEALTEAVRDAGFEGGVIRVFGERRRHIFLAGEDENGRKISSPELRESIERVMGVKLGTPEYFKNGRMALMECGVRRAFSVSLATAAASGNENEISGDTSVAFETASDCFYALLSDGMGSGEAAKRTSELVARFMRCALEIGAAKETVLHILSHTVRANTEECSATVDLFELDLYTGEATFLKSGAAPSYVKRDSSIFRIRSQTAPIGLLKTVDTERIRVEVRAGDYIVMLSDGVSQSTEDAPWLLELLAEPPIKNLKEYAKKILDAARENSRSGDDMSVIVMRVDGV